MDDSKVFMFPEGTKNGIDPGLLALLNQNGGFGNNGNWIWILFLWMMWGANGNGFGGGLNGNGTGFLANQLNNDAGRDLLLQAINGRADALGQLANLTHSSIESVKNNLFTIQSAIQSVGTQVGMSGLQTINALQLGNAGLSRQICECCCENRLAIATQTATLQADAARNFAAQQLQNAQNHSEDRLDVCQQTNAIITNDDRNTRSITDAIAAQSIMINDKFCELEKRELQSKINTQSDIITQLRGEISNDKQTEKFNLAFGVLNDKLNQLAAKQPNTVPVQWPNIVAANATPYVGNAYGYGYPQNNFWN